ncbi:MAG: polysaccharide biosynthesis/export family protein [Planctomycetota bacterium]
MRTKPLTLFLVLLFTGCAAAPPFDAKAVALEWAAYMQRDYALRAGDRLQIQIAQVGSQQPDGDIVQELTVSPTGSIDLPRLSQPMQVAGRTVGAVRTMVFEAYQQEQFTNPRVSLTLLEASAQSIYVCGEVGRSGAIPYQAGLTMTQAIASAGSVQYTAKESDVRVLRVAPDGTQRTFRVNLSAVLLDEQPDFLLLPGDVVYCQTSTIADLGNLVDLYIRRLLPFSLSGPSVGSIGN